MKFLIIDDSGLSRRMARKIVESFGHSAIEAEDGLRGIELYSVEHPDVVVLDLLMPGIPGLGTLASIKSFDPKCHVIICSSDLQTATRDKAMEMGAMGFINKPMHSDELRVLLDSIPEVALETRRTLTTI